MAIHHFGADLLAQKVDGNHLAIAAKVPVGPSVAGRCPFHRGTDLMDRPGHFRADKRAIGPDAGRLAARRGQHLAWAQHSAFNHLAEGHARFGPP